MAVDILNLSDEELLNLDLSQLDQMAGDTSGLTGSDTSGGDSNTETTGTDGAGLESNTDQVTGEGQGDTEVVTSEAGQTTGGVDAGQATEAKDKDKEGQGTATEVTGTSPASGSTEGTEGQGANSDSAQPPKSGEANKAETPPDYKAEIDKLLAPFPANGKEMQVRNVDEAITLMQMGANYNKKMAALKPNLKLLKMLEKNDLLSEEKISFLIDLEKKNPEAINKLIADSKIDPMDLDADKAGAYKPTDRSVNEKELELDEVLDEIQGTPSYDRTLNIVGKEWDGESRSVFANNPQLLRVVNDHVKSGIYDIIQAEVDRERALGRLKSVPDIEAYRQVGDAINARGGFAHLSTQGQQTKPPEQKVVVPAPKKVDDQKLNEKRMAAAPAKVAVAAAKPVQDFNPLALSDDEFLKLVKTDLL